LEGQFEVVVVDGGSTDRSVELAEKYARVVRSDRGRAKQMNEGAEQSKGEILLFLHADTYLPAQAILAVDDAMSDRSVVGGRFKVRLDNPAFPYRVIESGINGRDRLFHGFTGDQAIFVRRKVFEEMGGFQTIPLMEDLDFARRLRRRGKTVRIPLYVTSSSRRWESEGVVKTIILMWLLRIAYLIGGSPSVLKRFYPEVR
jgi:rSAM/selenodomain-associated transferase 2